MVVGTDYETVTFCQDFAEPFPSPSPAAFAGVTNWERGSRRNHRAEATHLRCSTSQDLAICLHAFLRWTHPLRSALGGPSWCFLEFHLPRQHKMVVDRQILMEESLWFCFLLQESMVDLLFWVMWWQLKSTLLGLLKIKPQPDLFCPCHSLALQ